jgi:hypothetical protein
MPAGLRQTYQRTLLGVQHRSKAYFIVVCNGKAWHYFPSKTEKSKDE